MVRNAQRSSFSWKYAAFHHHRDLSTSELVCRPPGGPDWLSVCLRERRRSGHVTNRNVLVVIWLLALSFWQPSKAQAVPILLTIQSTHMSFDHGSYDNAALSGLGSRGFAGNWMGLIPWGGGIGLFGTGAFGSGAGGFTGSGGAGGFAGSGGAGRFAGSGGAGGFAGSGGGFPGRGAGPNVAFAVITLLSLEHPSEWFHHDFTSPRSSSASLNTIASTAPPPRVPEPASALLFAAGAFLVLRSATRRQRT